MSLLRGIFHGAITSGTYRIYLSGHRNTKNAACEVRKKEGIKIYENGPGITPEPLFCAPVT